MKKAGFTLVFNDCSIFDCAHACGKCSVPWCGYAGRLCGMFRVVNIEKGMRFHGNQHNRGSVIDVAFLKTRNFTFLLEFFC